jgi:hypothetical protein
MRLPKGPKPGPLGGRATHMVQQRSTRVSGWRKCGIIEFLLHGSSTIVGGLRRYRAVRSVLASMPNVWMTQGSGLCRRYFWRAAEALDRPNGEDRSLRRLAVVVSDMTTATPATAASSPATAAGVKASACGAWWLRLQRLLGALHLPAWSDNGKGSSFGIADYCDSGSRSLVLLDEKASPLGKLSQGVDDASQRAA